MNTLASAAVLALALCSSFAAAAIEYRQVTDASCEALQFYAQNVTAGSVWVLDDMVVDENLLHVLQCTHRSEDKDSRLASDNTKWPGGVIPYVIDSSIPTEVYINDAIQTIEATTNMKMPLRTNEATYIRFVELSSSGACGSANIGKLSQSQVTFQYGFPYTGQPVSVKSNSGCGVGTAIHEIMHAAGVIHEHARDDRDDFVTINTQCIQSGAQNNFNKAGSNERTVYDFNSVMHYSQNAFSTGCATITAKPEFSNKQNSMGKCNGISACDIAGLNRLYTKGQTGGTKTCTYECFCDYDFNALPNKVKNIGKKNNCGPNSLLNSWTGTSPPPSPPPPPPPSPPPPNPLLLTPSIDFPYCVDDNDKTMKVKDTSIGFTEVTCSLGDFICGGQPFEAVLSDFICPVTCKTCPTPLLFHPSNFDGRIGWSFSPSTNIVEFYISSTESISSISTTVLCADNTADLQATSTSNVVVLVDDFVQVSGLSTGNGANIQFVAALGSNTSPLSPGDYAIGQSIVIFEQQCSDVVLSDVVVLNESGSALNICGADGILCFADGVDVTISPPPPSVAATGSLDFPVCKNAGPISAQDPEGQTVTFPCSFGETLCPGQALDSSFNLNGLGATVCPITCNSCPVPFLGFIGDFGARWSVAWEPSTGEGNFWVSSQVTIAGFQGQVECLEPANNPIISFSASTLTLPVTINPANGKFLIFSIDGFNLSPGDYLISTFNAQFESTCDVVGVIETVVSDEVGVEVSICGVNGFDCLVGVPSPPALVLGDVTGDGNVSVEDIIVVVGIVTGATVPDSDTFILADINSDNAVTVLDVINLTEIVIS